MILKRRNKEKLMSIHRIATLLGALAFLAVAAAALYRLFFGFTIRIGDVEIGQTSTFFTFVVCVALSLMLFRGGQART